MTPIQSKTLQAVKAYWREHAAAPSYRSLAKLAGTTVSNTHRIVKRLGEVGVIRFDNNGNMYPMEVIILSESVAEMVNHQLRGSEDATTFVNRKLRKMLK